MDTDDLSEEAYAGVLLTAEGLSHNLTLAFAVLAADCATEDDYLKECRRLIDMWIDQPEKINAEIFFDVPIPHMDQVTYTMLKIEANIKKVLMWPAKDRTRREW